MLKGSPTLYIPLLIWVFYDPAHAAAPTSPPLQQQAEDYLKQQLQLPEDDTVELRITLRQPDSRLKLEPCAEPVSFTSRRAIQTGAFSLKASCNYPRRWSRYLNGEITLLRQVWVSQRPLSKGHLLLPQDIHLNWIEQRQLRQGYFSADQPPVGQELSRSLASQRPITPNILNAPIVVRSGDSVSIMAGNTTLSVEMSGTALEDGRLGQQIRVENNRSGRTIKAKVLGSGKVSASR